MYKHHYDFYVKDYNNQGNLMRYLAIKEDSLTQKEFFKEVLSMQKNDSRNFFCAWVDTAGDSFAFIATNHTNYRVDTRTAYSKAFIRERAMELLKNTLISSEARSHILALDDDGSVKSGDGIISTNVVDEATNTIFCFQSGFQYVRLATVWNTGRGVFKTSHAKIIKLCKNGFIETNLGNIPEVHLDDNYVKKPRKYKFNTRVIHYH